MGDTVPQYEETDIDRLKYPVKPEKPLESDCCGFGCTTCVFDLYELELKRWQQKCDDVDQDLNTVDNHDVLSIYEYKDFEITGIDHVSSVIKIFKFQIPNNGKLTLKCGQHLVARCINDAGKRIIRPYTPVSKLTKRGFFKVAVKLYENGEMSKCMRDWDVGTIVQWRGPFGEFVYKVNQQRSMLMLAGGTGITPMIQVLMEILDNEDDFTFVWLIYSVASAEEIIMKEELPEWDSFWNCEIHYCLTGDNPGTSCMKYGNKVHLQKINGRLLKEVVPDAPNNTNVLICGTQSFNEDMHEFVVKTLGMEETNIFCFK